MLSQENLVVLRVKCLGYIDQRQTSVLPSIQGQNCLIRLQIVSYNPEGEGGHSRKGLIEVCRRCLQTLTQCLRLRMTEKHTFFEHFTEKEQQNSRPAKFN